MKLKNLRKKIRRLEKRLQEGPKKLAKLKGKLEAMETAKAREPSRKSAVRTRGAHRTEKPLTPIQRKRPAKTVDAEKPGAVKKATRKLNLSPERRAQLAAAMKARWAAKRAAAETNPEPASTDQASTLERTPPQPLESRYEGA
jgi:hypothetical protein